MHYKIYPEQHRLQFSVIAAAAATTVGYYVSN